jgi:hypothetical protein
MIDLADFSYEDDGHIYRDSQGEMCSATGSLKKAGIVDYSMVDPVLLEMKKVLGNNVHRWTARHDLKQNPDPMELTAREWGYATSWLNFKKDFLPDFLHVEVPKMGIIGGYRCGGTADNIAYMKRAMWIIDKKCCSSPMAAWELQLADYEMIETKLPYLGVFNRMSVRLGPNGKYYPTVYTDPQAAQVATAALTLAYDPTNAWGRTTVDAWKYNHRVM